MTSPEAPPRSGHRRAGSVAVAVTTSLAITLWVLHGTWGSGEYLVRDFVAVPEPARPTTLLPGSASALRAWPLDAVGWLLSGVLAPGVQQAVMLVAALLLAGVGAGLLAARWGGAAVAAASALAVWNPYVTERLLLGQPPTLLGYSMLPWVLLVARSRPGPGARALLLALVMAPAALTPWGGAAAATTAVLATLSRRDGDRRGVILAVVVGLGWCLPWVVPALVAGGVPADPDGAAAFALRDDSGLGTWFSAATGGGVWGSDAVPRSRQDPVALIASGALLLVALGGALVVRRLLGRGAGGLAALGLLGPATLLALTSGPLLGVLGAAQGVPGVALVRDQHRLLAPAVLVAAVLAGLLVGTVNRLGGRLAGGAAAALVLTLGVASVPDLPRSVGAAYRPVPYPGSWARVLEAVDARPGRPTVVSLPWQPLRRPAWAPRQPFLDPLPRAVRAEVLVDTTLTVRRDGQTLEVGEGAPGAPGWSAGEVDAASLRARGVDLVVEWLGTPGALPTRRDGWVEVLATDDFRVWDVTSAR